MVIGFLVAPVLKQQVRAVLGNVSRGLLLTCVLETVRVFTFCAESGADYRRRLHPTVATFGGMGVVVTVALAVMILKERVEANQRSGYS